MADAQVGASGTQFLLKDGVDFPNYWHPPAKHTVRLFLMVARLLTL
jgi:hypothetical protein